MSESTFTQGESSQAEGALAKKEHDTLALVTKVVRKHHERVGTDERLEDSVANVIAGALRKADVADHARLADAIAPIVISGIRREIRNSREEMVEALYPMVGRLISAYAASASREMLYRADERLESVVTGKFLRLRIKSWLTGVPYRELALREAFGLQVRDLLLIKRGSGELLDKWQADPEPKAGSGNELLLTSMLTAITEFAKQALADEHGELRELNLGSSRVFLRATPTYLIAARCIGRGGRAVEQRLDRALMQFVEEYSRELERSEGRAHTASGNLLPKLAETLSVSLAPQPGERRTGRSRPVFAIAALVILLSLGAVWQGHAIMQRAEAREVKKQVETILYQSPDFAGFPVQIEVPPGGGRVILTGAAPSQKAIQDLSNSLTQTLGPVEVVVDNLVVRTTTVVAGTLDGVARIVDRLGDLENRLLTAVLSPTSRVLTKVLGPSLVEATHLDTILTRVQTNQVLQKVSYGLSGLSSALKELGPKLAEPKATAVVSGLVEQIGQLQQRLTGLSALSAQQPASGGLLKLPVDKGLLTAALTSDELPSPTPIRTLATGLEGTVQNLRGQLELERMRAGLSKVTGAVRKLLADYRRPEIGPIEFAVDDADAPVERGANGLEVALPKVRSLLSREIDWTQDDLPDHAPSGGLGTLFAHRLDATEVTADREDMHVRVMPFVDVPGLGRVDLLGTTQTLAGTVVGGTKGVVRSTVHGVGSTVQTVGSTVGTAVHGVGSTVHTVGSTVNDVLTSGTPVKSAVQGVGATVKSVGATVKGTVGGLLGGRKK